MPLLVPESSFWSTESKLVYLFRGLIKYNEDEYNRIAGNRIAGSHPLIGEPFSCPKYSRKEEP